MGRVGACGNNVGMESFFALLQKNILDRQRWSIREQLRLAIVTWIEKTNHRKRRQRRLGKLTPIEFETINQAAHAARATQPRQSTELGAVPSDPAVSGTGCISPYVGRPLRSQSSGPVIGNRRCSECETGCSAHAACVPRIRGPWIELHRTRLCDRPSPPALPRWEAASGEQHLESHT
mgnify:CR=1 FL=1